MSHESAVTSTTRYNLFGVEAGASVWANDLREETNMNERVECMRCHAHMEVGYVPDVTYGGYLLQNWCPGEPKSGFWMRPGLKVKKDQFIPVTTLRCPNCGYLESYAIPRTVSDKS